MKYVSLLLVVFWPVLALADETPRQIVVSATGSSEAVPDMATVTLGVSEQARTASDAMSAASVASRKVLDSILGSGVDARDVRTSSINLNPVWDQSNARPREIRGYMASIMLTVRVRDLDALGGILDLVIADGANALNGLNFGISDIAPVQEAARMDAVARARDKAVTLAEAAGVTLGPIQTITEGASGGGPTPMMRGAMMETAALPVAAGELNVQVNVTVVYSIAD